jgi:hypothetical protein
VTVVVVVTIVVSVVVVGVLVAEVAVEVGIVVVVVVAPVSAVVAVVVVVTISGALCIAGIRELDVTDTEPIHIDEISIALGSGPNGYRATFNDIEAYGVSNMSIVGVR